MFELIFYSTKAMCCLVELNGMINGNTILYSYKVIRNYHNK